MADKMTCPGCDSTTSAILRAYAEGQPCPVCGLSAMAAFEVNQAQMSSANDKLVAKYAALVISNDKARRKLGWYEGWLYRMRELVEELEETRFHG